MKNLLGRGGVTVEALALPLPEQQKGTPYLLAGLDHAEEPGG